MAQSIRALFEATTGDIVTSTNWAELAQRDPRGAATRVRVWADRAAARNAATAGDTRSAAELAIRAGHAARIGTHCVWAAFAYHDAVRFGHSEMAHAPLHELALDDRGPLVRQLADHAAAVAGS